MILKKDDFPKKETNKKYNKNSNYIIRNNKKLNNKYENKYFHKRNVKNIDYSSLKEILNDKNISKNDKINNDNKKTSSLTINNNIIKRTNINSVTTRNKFIRNQNTNILDNIKGMETEYDIYNKVNNINNNLYSTINETKKNRQKNASMEQRHNRKDDEIFINENKVNDTKQNNIYSRLYKYNSSSSELQKNFENQFNIKDAKNILNINYFYDKREQNLEDMDHLFYTNFYNEKYRKRIKVNNKNKHNSLIMNNENDEYLQEIPTKTINSFYIRKNPINLVKNINNNIIVKDDDISNRHYFNKIKYIETEEKNRIRNNRPRHHSMVERNNMNYSPDRFYTNTLNNYINNKVEKTDKKIIRRNGNKIKIFKKNNNTSIQEYNLSLGNDEDDSENDDFDITDNELINNRNKIRYILTNNIIKKNQELNDVNKYYKYFTKNIRPIITSQFSIKNNNISKLDLPKKNFINVNKAHNNSFHKRKIISNKKDYEENINFAGTPNFSEAGKTPKNNNINLFNQKIKTLSFNGKKETELIKENQNKIRNNDIFKISQNENIEIINNKNNDANIENKFVFKTEEEIINYVYKKFEEERKKKSYFNRKLRFTGFILTKKYKGKNIFDIRIEDSLDQINQKLNDENVLINEKKVELFYADDLNLNRFKNLEEENKKLKEEIELMKKKENFKNE